jgi:hypothetical protein
VRNCLHLTRTRKVSRYPALREEFRRTGSPAYIDPVNATRSELSKPLLQKYSPMNCSWVCAPGLPRMVFLRNQKHLTNAAFFRSCLSLGSILERHFGTDGNHQLAILHSSVAVLVAAEGVSASAVAASRHEQARIASVALRSSPTNRIPDRYTQKSVCYLESKKPERGLQGRGPSAA